MTQPQAAEPYEGREVVDPDGRTVGTAGTVLAGGTTGGPQWLVVRSGLAGRNERLVPLAQVIDDGDRLRVPHTKEHVEAVPPLSGHYLLTEREDEHLCRHYGLPYAELRDDG